MTKQCLCESIKKICGRYGIQTHFKGSNTIRNLLVCPKDKDPMVSKSGAIYWFQCGDLSCDDEYIWETSKTFAERYREHLKDPSPIHQHSNHTRYPTSHNNFQIIEREGRSLSRKLKESIFIRINNSPIVCTVLALDSWNYCSGEQAQQPNIHKIPQSFLYT